MHADSIGVFCGLDLITIEFNKCNIDMYEATKANI